MSELERCYRILGLELDASIEEVNQAYKDLVFIWHPDRLPKDNPRLLQKPRKSSKKSTTHGILCGISAIVKPSRLSLPSLALPLLATTSLTITVRRSLLRLAIKPLSILKLGTLRKQNHRTKPRPTAIRLKRVATLRTAMLKMDMGRQGRLKMAMLRMVNTAKMNPSRARLLSKATIHSRTIGQNTIAPSQRSSLINMLSRTTLSNIIANRKRPPDLTLQT